MEKIFIRVSRTFEYDKEQGMELVEKFEGQSEEEVFDTITELLNDESVKPTLAIADFDLDDFNAIHERVELERKHKEDFINDLRESGMSEEEIEFAVFLQEMMG